ncbi:MAG: hypothetical protein KKA73_10700 [Chloroflexi bacterium]|nr:hypothetical protein [Chloroflexota bacterium]MBU1748146.1 hypothetical protein [Chloroflexota bacterium]
MNPVFLGLVTAMLAAVLGMMLAYRLLPVSGGFWARRTVVVTSRADEDKSAAWLVMLRPVTNLLRPILPAQLVANAERRGWWVGGMWAGVDGVSFYALSLTLGLGGALVATTTGNPLFVLGGALVGLVAPTFLTMGRAKRAQRDFRRRLADYVELLSLLVAQGKSIPNAITELGYEQTRVSNFFVQVLAESAGRDFYDLLLQRAEVLGVDALVFLAAELQLIHTQGRGERELLEALAADVRRQNKREMLLQARGLSNQLVFPLILFFFVPFLIVLMTPMFVSVIGLLGM